MDGIIKPDLGFAKEIGFTSDKFAGYLWRKGQTIIISFIVSRMEGRGNLRELFARILARGYSIQVPTPTPRMEWICRRMGFEKRLIKDSSMGPLEVMELKQKKRKKGEENDAGKEHGKISG